MLDVAYRFIRNLTNLMVKKGVKPVIASVILLIVLYVHFSIIDNKIPLWKKEVKKEIRDEHVNEINKYIESSVNYDFRVSELMKELLVNLRADRIYINMYHNGGTFSNGIPFIKATNTYEVTSIGVMPQIKNFQQLPISIYAYFNKAVVLKKILQITDVESYQDRDIGAYQILKAKDVKSTYIIGLYNQQDIPVGFMGIEYCRNLIKLDSIDVEILKRNSIYIASLLN